MAYTNTRNPLQNVLVFDAVGTAIIPKTIRALGLQSAGFVKTTANGTFYIDTSPGVTSGHTIYNQAGVALPQRAGMKFVRLNVTDDVANNSTVVTRPADSFVGTTSPPNPAEGDIWTNSETWKTYLYYDSYWVEMGGGTISGGSGGGSGSGTVTSVSVNTANGFSGTVTSPNTSAAITLATTVTGMLKGNGTSITAAVAGTDYIAPASLYVDYDYNVVGVRNGVNKTFTTSYHFVAGSAKVYVNGLRYTPGASNDYLETGSNEITFTLAPDNGDILIIEYIKL